jgi:TonB family protein
MSSRFRQALLASLLVHLALICLVGDRSPVAETDPRPEAVLIELRPSTSRAPGSGGFSVVEPVAGSPAVSVVAADVDSAPQARPVESSVDGEAPAFVTLGGGGPFSGLGGGAGAEGADQPRLVRTAPLQPRPELLGDDWEGTVLLRLYIDDAGLPLSVRVQESSGNPHADADALQYAQQSRWQPATRNGRPVGGWVDWLIRYERQPKRW